MRSFSYPQASGLHDEVIAEEGNRTYLAGWGWEERCLPRTWQAYLATPGYPNDPPSSTTCMLTNSMMLQEYATFVRRDELANYSHLHFIEQHPAQGCATAVHRDELANKHA